MGCDGTDSVVSDWSVIHFSMYAEIVKYSGKYFGSLPVVLSEPRIAYLLYIKICDIFIYNILMDLRYADAHTNAILQAWYPGAEGGTAVADVLFGRVSPSGKLPVTFYKDTSDLPEFTDYSMKNRTYRYMEQEALYPFGFGLTYGNVKVSAAEFAEKPEKEKPVKIRCTVTNTGKRDTEEVVQVYIKDRESKYAVRNHSLCGFRRVEVKAGESIETELTIDLRAFTIVDEEGKRYVDSNKFSLYVATTQPDARSTALTGHEAVELRVVFE